MDESDERGERGERGRPDERAGQRARRLPEELRELGRSLDRPGADSSTMAERVIAQIIAESVPVPVAEPPGRLDRLRRWLRARWRIVTAALCGLLTAAVLTPPVRAAVFDWFDFGGVEVRYDPSGAPPTRAGVPGCGGAMTLSEAERRAGFVPAVPAALGAPDAVAVTREPGRASWSASAGATTAGRYVLTSSARASTPASARRCGCGRSGSRWAVRRGCGSRCPIGSRSGWWRATAIGGSGPSGRRGRRCCGRTGQI